MSASLFGGYLSNVISIFTHYKIRVFKHTNTTVITVNVLLPVYITQYTIFQRKLYLSYLLGDTEKSTSTAFPCSMIALSLASGSNIDIDDFDSNPAIVII